MLKVLRRGTSQNLLLGPFIDGVDGATPLTGLTIANTDIRVSKNGLNMVAKNSGGATHDENGMYTMTLDATDTDTVGLLQLSCKMAGALSVWDDFQIVEEAVYDRLYAASAAGYSTHDPAAVWANPTRELTSAAKITSTGQPVILHTDDKVLLAATNHTGAILSSCNITYCNGIPVAGPDDFKATGFSTHSAADVWVSATRTLTSADNITSTGGTTVPQTGDSYARLGAPAGASVSADIASIKNDTATGGVLVAPSGLDLIVVETGLNARQALSTTAAALAGVLSGAETTDVVIRAANDPATTRINATVDADGNRSVVTLTLPT